jgi:protein O-GlcNAc transferase
MASSTDPIIVELVDGTKVVVPDSLELITSYVLQEQRDWFEDEIKFLRELVQPGDVVVDIGANYGVYALSLARNVGASGQVWAFEPASETAMLLRKSASANHMPWLQVVQQALTDREGTAWLQMPGHPELNSLVHPSSLEFAAQQGCGASVSITTLDRCLEIHAWDRVDLLKLDAEGEEVRILSGGQRFFQELSPLVMFEVKAGTKLNLDLVLQFQELGYQSFQLIPGLNSLVPFAADHQVDGYLLNLFAAKPDRIETLAADGWLVDGSLAIATDSEAAFFMDPRLKALKEKPYASGLAASWELDPQQPDRAAVCRALAAWCFAQDHEQPTASRSAALSQSLVLLQQAYQPGCNPGRLASLARVARACGERVQAVEALNALVGELQTGSRLDLYEPFLSPEPTFDSLTPAELAETWLEAAALSAIEQLSSFSGFYTGQDAIPRLERINSLGFILDPIYRRIQLVQQRYQALTNCLPLPLQSCQTSQGANGAIPPELTSGSLQQAKQQAMELIGAERYSEAQQIYEWLLASGQADAQVCANLAALHQIAGRADESIPLLEQAIALQPAYPEALLNLGNALQSTGRSEDAIMAFRQAIALNRSLPEAHTGLGVALQAHGQLDEAILHHREALELRPAYPAAWSNLGLALRTKGDCLQEAIAAFREALKLKPEYPEALSNLGLALLTDGQSEAGLASQRQAIAINPNLPQLYLNLGDGLLELNRLPEAIDAFRTAIQVKADEPKAYFGMARAHQLLGDFEQALLIAEQGLAIDPDWLPIQWIKFQLLNMLERPEAAADVVEAMLTNQPDCGMSHLVKACLLQETHHNDECHRTLDQALRLDPSLYGAHYCRSHLFLAAGKFQDAIAALKQAVAVAPSFYGGHSSRFYLDLICHGEQGERIRIEAEQFWRQYSTPRVDPFPPREAIATQVLSNAAQIRLLLISGDIGNHSVSCFLEPVLRGIDRHRFHLVLALTHRRHEARAQELEQLADELVDLTGLGEAEAVAVLRQRSCAVAIDTSGWTEHNPLRLLRHRVAPVQCHYVGFCGTTGLANMDYMIGDGVLTPPELQNHFSERILALPRCWSTYAPTFTPPPLRDRLEGAPITFGSFNNLLKVGERCLQFWAAALQSVPTAQLLLKDKSCVDSSVRHRILNPLTALGVDPARVRFIDRLADWNDHMDLYNQVDIALDTTPMTSATTGFEAICMGVPLLAIQTDWMGGRMSSSALSALGRGDWISREPVAFAALAAELAAGIEREPNQLKRQLHRQVRASELWDGASLCRSLEQAFEQMLQQCAGGCR